MDSDQLRWALLIIGTVLIVAVYMFGRHQNKLRNRAAIKTYTQDEIDDPYIDDDTLRQELKHLDDVLSDPDQSDFKEININPGIEAEYSSNLDEKLFIKEHCETTHHLVSYLLKRADGSQLVKSEVHSMLLKNDFLSDAKNEYLYFDHQQELFSAALQIAKGEDSERVFAICLYMDKVVHRKNANQSFEKMLRIIDQLANQLNVKVYNQNQSLLTLEDITLIRKQLLQIDE